MEYSRKPLFLIFVLLGLLIVITAPYLLAASPGEPGYVFGGFLLNPIDGNSYLAKMYQGWQGSWTFRLPYTAEPGKGAYLFLYYLFLGHIARFLDLPLLLVYHLARICGAIALVLALDRFFLTTMPTKRAYWIAMLLAVFGSGMGWMAALFGGFTSDLWVAEAYPFLSAYTNPHFPLGLALLVWLLTPGRGLEAKELHHHPLSLSARMLALFPLSKNPLNPPYQGGQGGIRRSTAHILRFPVQLILVALALGIVLPFGVVIALAVLAGVFVLEFASGRGQAASLGACLNNPVLPRLMLVFFGGAPAIAYDLWVANTNPALSAWNAQNLTLTPPAWDVLLSFSPVFWLAIPGAIRVARERRRGHSCVLLSWAFLGILLVFLPVGLQRRFMTGLYIPLVGLAVIGLEGVISGFPGWDKRNPTLVSGEGRIQLKKRQMVWFVALILALPSNLLVISAGVHGIQARDPAIYLTAGESRALKWVAEHTAPDAVILAAPEMGLFIPAWTGRRVLYGHPFETVQAVQNAALVRTFFQGASSSGSDGLPYEVDYIFDGPRERALGDGFDGSDLEAVYRTDGVTIYKVMQ